MPEDAIETDEANALPWDIAIPTEFKVIRIHADRVMAEGDWRETFRNWPYEVLVGPINWLDDLTIDLNPGDPPAVTGTLPEPAATREAKMNLLPDAVLKISLQATSPSLAFFLALHSRIF